MQAMVLAQFGSPAVLVGKEVPTPRPGRGEVRVRVRACGVCHLDTIVRSGLRRCAALPLILGHEIAGEVDAIGDGAHDLPVGTRVVSQVRATCGECAACRTGRENVCQAEGTAFGLGRPGGYAEYVVVPARNLCRLPSALSWEQGAVAVCAVATAFRAVHTLARVQPGETVLVTGASGGLGVHAVQMARALNARVIGVTGTRGKIPRLKEIGCDEVLESDENLARRMKGVTGGRGVDVVIENLGSATLGAVLGGVALGARIVVTGELTGAPASFNPVGIIFKEVRVLGCHEATRSEVEQVLGLIEHGILAPRIAEALALKDAAKAHELLRDRAVVGRLVLRP